MVYCVNPQLIAYSNCAVFLSIVSYHRKCSCTNICEHCKEEQQNSFTSQLVGSIIVKCRPVSVLGDIARTLGTSALHVLEPCDLNLKDTSWSAFSYYTVFSLVRIHIRKQQFYQHPSSLVGSKWAGAKLGSGLLLRKYDT